MACENCEVKFSDYHSDELYTWCTNCGNYGIAAALKRALVAEEIAPKDIVLCFDIGCNGNGSDKLQGYRIHGLHGRVLPLAAGASVANNKLKVIASAGDGATLSEGINHLIHSIRANYNITFLLHNNSNYGLTTGQASSTTKPGVPMNSSPDGVTSDTLNVMELVLALNPSFAARTFSGDVKQMTEIIRAGINHKGFAVIEILQHCPTYNKATPHEWYQERVYDVSSLSDYNATDLAKAKEVASDLEQKIATGILYQDKDRPDFYSRLVNRREITTELVEEVQNVNIEKLVSAFRV
jgi:2-oxoglutarate ferredoxin oxidoreductase subunit beta